MGTVAAALYALGKRSVEQLRQGQLLHVLIQGDEGNIIVTMVTHEVILLALADIKVPLGMAFAEVRALAGKIAQILA